MPCAALSSKKPLCMPVRRCGKRLPSSCSALRAPRLHPLARSTSPLARRSPRASWLNRLLHLALLRRHCQTLCTRLKPSAPRLRAALSFYARGFSSCRRRRLPVPLLRCCRGGMKALTRSPKLTRARRLVTWPQMPTCALPATRRHWASSRISSAASSARSASSRPAARLLWLRTTTRCSSPRCRPKPSGCRGAPQRLTGCRPSSSESRR